MGGTWAIDVPKFRKDCYQLCPLFYVLSPPGGCKAWLYFRPRNFLLNSWLLLTEIKHRTSFRQLIGLLPLVCPMLHNCMNTQVHPHYLGSYFWKQILTNSNIGFSCKRLVISVTIFTIYITYRRIFTSLCYICLCHLKCWISSSLLNYIYVSWRLKSNPTFFTGYIFPDYSDIFLL